MLLLVRAEESRGDGAQPALARGTQGLVGCGLLGRPGAARFGEQALLFPGPARPAGGGGGGAGGGGGGGPEPVARGRLVRRVPVGVARRRGGRGGDACLAGWLRAQHVDST